MKSSEREETIEGTQDDVETEHAKNLTLSNSRENAGGIRELLAQKDRRKAIHDSNMPKRV